VDSTLEAQAKHFVKQQSEVELGIELRQLGNPNRL
jgi:hypothetical protein